MCLFIGFSAFADTGPFTRVTILDRNSNILRVFDQPDDLDYLKNIWENRSKITGTSAFMHWDYQIDIQTRDQSTRWLYDSQTGLCMVLSKDLMPVFYIKKFDILNTAVYAPPQERIIWVIDERQPDYGYWSRYDRRDWRGDHDHGRYDKDRRSERGHRDEHRDFKRDNKRDYENRPPEDKRKDDYHRDRDDEKKWKPVPVVRPQEDKRERRKEPEGRPQVDPEKKDSTPIPMPLIDTRKLPGIREPARD